jgi:hypothetical protein
MNQTTLITHIEMVFEREKILLKNDKIPWSIQESNNNAMLIYETANTLINLYEGLSDLELKNIFIDYLSRNFIEDNEVVFAYENGFSSDVQSFSSTTALTFFVLLTLGFKDKLIDAIKIRQEQLTEFKEKLISMFSRYGFDNKYAVLLQENVEYFRLAKNIGIEISLFLLSKANNLKVLRHMAPIDTDIDF